MSLFDHMVLAFPHARGPAKGAEGLYEGAGIGGKSCCQCSAESRVLVSLPKVEDDQAYELEHGA